MSVVVPLIEPLQGCRERALRALVELPPFSPVLNRLLATLSDEATSVAKVAEIIEADAVIAGNVLKLVNSALYGRRGTVNSVRHAVSLLGINKLRNTVFAMSISRVWSHVKTAPGWSTARFNLHEVATGLMCDHLAQHLRVAYPEGAFAAGLFHDLGELLIAVAFRQEYAAIQALYQGSDQPLHVCELNVLGVSHPDLSADALTAWNLPEPIRRAVKYHHSPEEDSDPGRQGKFGLSLVLSCADRFVNMSGISIRKEDEKGIQEAGDPFAPLGLELASVDFLDQFESELRVLGGLFH
jgi:HD-like signal output (HDOD) protein